MTDHHALLKDIDFDIIFRAWTKEDDLAERNDLNTTPVLSFMLNDGAFNPLKFISNEDKHLRCHLITNEPYHIPSSTSSFFPAIHRAVRNAQASITQYSLFIDQTSFRFFVISLKANL